MNQGVGSVYGAVGLGRVQGRRGHLRDVSVGRDAVVEGALVRRRFGPLARTRYGCCTPHSGQSSFVETKGYQHTRQRLSFPALNTRIEQ